MTPSPKPENLKTRLARHPNLLLIGTAAYPWDLDQLQREYEAEGYRVTRAANGTQLLREGL